MDNRRRLQLAASLVQRLAGRGTERKLRNAWVEQMPHRCLHQHRGPDPIAYVIVWRAMLERFRSVEFGATLLWCAGKLQHQEGVIHIAAERLRDMTPRLYISPDGIGDTERRPPPKPPFARTTKSPGYDARDIVIASRNFR